MAENFLSPGVVIRELRAGVPQIRGVPTSVGGMLGQTYKGPANKKVRVSSFAQFVRIFGTYNPSSYLAESVDAAFKNGASAIYIVRVLGSAGGGAANVKASKQLQTAGAVNALTVTAVGEGVLGNSQKVKIDAENTSFGLILGANIAMGSVTSVSLTAAGIAKVAVGDTLKIADGTTTIRGVVKQIKDTTVMFETSATAGAPITAALGIVTLETFALTYYENSAIIQGPFKGLRVSPLSQKNYFMVRINTNNDENQFTVTDQAAPIGASLDNRPANTVAGGDLLTGGDEFTTYADTVYQGNQSSGTGVYALDKAKDLRLVAIPGVTGTTTGAVSKSLLDYCTARGDCFAIIEPPLGTAPSGLSAYKDAVGGTSYGAMYYPWVQVIDPLTAQPSYQPPSGFAMGVFARTDRTRGIAKAPAGEVDGKIAGVIGVERELTDDDRNVAYPLNINPIVNISGVGQCIMGSRTLESSEFNQINVRRTFIYLEQSIREGTNFVLFEPNDAATRAKVRRTIAAFLATEWKKGNLDGTTLDKAFYVTCDESNNPPVVINEGKMVIDVGVNIPRTTEWLVIQIQQDQRGAQAALGV